MVKGRERKWEEDEFSMLISGFIVDWPACQSVQQCSRHWEDPFSFKKLVRQEFLTVCYISQPFCHHPHELFLGLIKRTKFECFGSSDPVKVMILTVQASEADFLYFYRTLTCNGSGHYHFTLYKIMVY